MPELLNKHVCFQKKPKIPPAGATAATADAPGRQVINTGRRHSFRKENLPELTPTSSIKECKRWTNAARREAERADLSSEPRAVQVATITMAMGAELKEQVSDHCGSDLDAPAASHGLTLAQVLDRVEKFFLSQSDQLAALVTMLCREQSAGETAGEFATELRRLVQFTELAALGNASSEAVVLGAFVAGLRSDEWRQKVLELKGSDGKPPTMKRALEKVKQLETLATQREKFKRAPAMQVQPQEAEPDVNKVSAYRRKKDPLEKADRRQNNIPTWNFCKKRSHLEADCWTKQKAEKAKQYQNDKAEKATANTTTVYVSTATITEPLADIGALRRVDVDAEVEVGQALLAGQVAQVLADTGSGVTLLPLNIVKDMARKSGSPRAYTLPPTNIDIRTANGQKVDVHSKVIARLSWKGRRPLLIHLQPPERDLQRRA